MARNSRKNVGFMDVLPWALIGGGAGWVLYNVVKQAAAPARAVPSVRPPSRPGETVAAPPAPVVSPSSYRDLAAVDTRFAQVRELYRMGRFTPQQALEELDTLSAAAEGLADQDPELSDDIVARIASFRGDVENFIRLQGEGVVAPTPTAIGTRYPVVNRRPR